MKIKKKIPFKQKNQKSRKPLISSAAGNQKRNIRQDNAENRGLWIYGKHPVFMAFLAQKREIFQILVTENTKKSLEEFLEKNFLTAKYQRLIKLVENDYINAIIDESKTHQGFAINCSYLEVKNHQDLLSKLQKIKAAQGKLPPILITDQISDPHNLGAIIRSAAAFNVKDIVVTENNSNQETATICKTSSGVIEVVNLFCVINLSNLIKDLKDLGYWCVGLDGEAKQNIDAIGNFENLALIVGSEGSGIRKLVKKNCDILAKIPMNEQVESLNASVACAIAIYELYNKKKINEI